ncbi:MAG: hypothetical protein C3F11_03855 [Methylocystaceae bacterium]|nr:MAG: hypothetical protein C3F11_03855 [Methylocystaceae bacterium]
MEQTVVLTLARSDAEALVDSLQRRAERLCDIRKEICEPDLCENFEREELAFFEKENELVERVLTALRAVLKTR